MDSKKPQVPPLRYAPVGMTIQLDNERYHSEIIDFSTKLSSRPERSAVEGPAVRLSLTQRLGAPFKPYFGLSGINSTRRAFFIIRRKRSDLRFSFPTHGPC